ncbi:MAG: hypothetical protein HOK97_21250 [Deltaproteobacteria bacterium]|nr:hypothetical protein [Deltaproteobacteria bacterium]MBT6492311.1 hypothetical protein [Deltaproteobacteria bacterium]
MRILSLTLLILSLALSACGTQETSDAQPESGEQQNTETETETGDDEDSIHVGSSPTSCGSESQGLEPVDCTMHGDVNAFCVFSNHCFCSAADGFQCESESQWQSLEECNPGSTCIPIED